MGTIIGQSGGVETYPADAHDLESYRLAEADLAKLRSPVLLHADSPHERLYIAALDGTGFFRAASFGSPPRCCASTTAAASATANTRVKSAVTQRIVVIVPLDQSIKMARKP